MTTRKITNLLLFGLLLLSACGTGFHPSQPAANEESAGGEEQPAATPPFVITGTVEPPTPPAQP